MEYPICLCLSVCLYICMSICLYFHLSVCPSVCMSICLSVCLSVCQFVCQANIHRISNMARKTYLLLWLCLLRVYQGYLGLEHNLWNPESQKHTFQECLFSWPILDRLGRSWVNLSMPRTVCLPVCISFCQSVSLSVSLYLCLSVSLLTSLFVCHGWHPKGLLIKLACWYMALWHQAIMQHTYIKLRTRSHMW